MNQIKRHQPILLVEDSEDDYKAMVRAFKKSGNLVNPIYRCRTGEEALDYIFQKGPYANPSEAPRPGIILLDLNLPGTDGEEVLKTIKADENLKLIPVIIVTTSDDPIDIENCYRLGANTYVKKPLDLEQFFAAIKRLKHYWFELAIIPKVKDDP